MPRMNRLGVCVKFIGGPFLSILGASFFVFKGVGNKIFFWGD